MRKRKPPPKKKKNQQENQVVPIYTYDLNNEENRSYVSLHLFSWVVTKHQATSLSNFPKLFTVIYICIFLGQHIYFLHWKKWQTWVFKKITKKKKKPKRSNISNEFVWFSSLPEALSLFKNHGLAPPPKKKRRSSGHSGSTEPWSSLQSPGPSSNSLCAVQQKFKHFFGLGFSLLWQWYQPWWYTW